MSALSPLSPLAHAAFRSLAHAGSIAAGATCGTLLHGEAGQESLGTRVRFELMVQDDRIAKVRFRAYGCAHTLAVCEWLAQQLEGQERGSIFVGNPIDWADKLEITQYKLGRLLVIEDALNAALESGSVSTKQR